MHIDCLNSNLCAYSVNRHMAKTVEESLLGDHSDQWMDSDCPEAKRMKVSHATYFVGMTLPQAQERECKRYSSMAACMWSKS